MEDLPVPVFELGTDGNISYANKSARTKFGYKSSEVEGMSIFSLIHKSQHERLKQKILQFKRNMEKSSSEYIAVKKNGKHIPIIIHSKRRIKNGEITIIGTLVDISTQKKTEDKLDQTKRKYMDLFENSNEGLYQAKRSGKLLNINNSFAKIFGYPSKEDFFSKISNIKQLYNNKEKRKIFNDIIKEQGSINNFETSASKKNGENIWIHENAKKVFDEKGNFKYYSGAIIDITAKKEFENQLKLANEETTNLNKFIQGIIDGINEEILVIEPYTRKILYANNKILSRTGLTLEQIKKKKCYEIYHGKKTCPSCKLNQMINTNIEYEKKYIDHNGNAVYTSIACHPIVDKNGKTDKIIHIAKDITKKKRYQDELKELNERLLKLYNTSTSLQKAMDIPKIYDIAIKAFESLGFERIRVYSYKNNYLHGEISNYLDNKEFKKLRFPVVKRNKKAYNCITYKKPIIESVQGGRNIASFLKKPQGLQNGSLPLISENKVVGMISLDNYYSKKPLLKKDLEILMTFANQIAGTIERALAQQENLNQLNKLSTLYEISSTITQTLDLQKIINMISIRLVKLLKVDRCSIFLLDDENKKIIKEAVFDAKEEDQEPQKFSLENTITHNAIKGNRIIYIEDTSLKKNYKKYNDVSPGKYKSFIVIPLSIENKAIGVINIDSIDKRNFSNDEIELIKALSSNISMMIENSWLYERIRHDKDNFSALLTLTQKTNKIRNLDVLINEMLKHTVSLTNADHGFVLLRDENHLELTAVEGGYSREQLRLKIGEGIAGVVAKSGEPIIVADCQEEKRYVHIDKAMGSCASIPLIKEDKVMGVLHLESKKKNNFKFFEKSLRVLTNHITIFIENIRLYERILNFNKELEKEINEATRELQEKNKKLQKMDKMKSDFVSNVSHELRTPLTSISGYTKLLNMEKLGELNKEQKNVISIIINESDRLSRLINEVLDLSKLEAGKVEVKFEEIKFKNIVDETIESLESIATEKNISIKTKIGKDVDYIHANYDLIKQVLINLLSNALKFTPEKGKVTIQAKTKDKSLVIEVEDTGKGIKKDHIPKLFDRFYQVDSSMTREQGGTGLGLVIVKHIIDLHNGKIDVKSKVGKGSTFIVTLPLRQENDKENFVREQKNDDL